jgi:LysM repeat protein
MDCASILTNLTNGMKYATLKGDIIYSRLPGGPGGWLNFDKGEDLQMKIKPILHSIMILTIASILVIGLAGCVKTASKGPSLATPTSAEGSLPVPGSTDENMGIFGDFGTQTAVAMTTPEAATATVVAPPDVATATLVGEAPTPTEVPAVVPVEPTVVPTATTAPVVVSVPTVTPGIPASYTLQQGEFPFCIARRFNLDVGELLSLNSLGLNSQPTAGFVLKLPQTGHTFPAARALKAHPTTYTVAANDTINHIACLYGDVSPDMIVLVNNLKAPYTLKAGQTLQIP